MTRFVLMSLPDTLSRIQLSVLMRTHSAPAAAASDLRTDERYRHNPLGTQLELDAVVEPKKKRRPPPRPEEEEDHEVLLPMRKLLVVHFYERRVRVSKATSAEMQYLKYLANLC